MMHDSPVFGGQRGERGPAGGRSRGARAARGAGVLAAAAVALAGMAVPAGAASVVAGGREPRRFVSVQGVLRDVTAISASSAWAVGDNSAVPGQPILARWDGRKWAGVTSPALPSAGQLEGVAKFPGGAWAVGESGTAAEHLVVLRLSGTTARRVPTPDVGGGELRDVAAMSAANAWAVGRTSGGRALALHWNGTRWTRTPLPPGASSLGGVAATSTVNAWAVGAGRQGGPVILRWNGKRWRSVAFAAPGGRELDLAAVTATSAGNAWAVGTSFTPVGAATVILHWDGRKWQRVPSPNPVLGKDIDVVNAVAASSARNAWAVGGTSTAVEGLLIEHWNGTAWTAVLGPAVTGGLAGVSISPSGRAWAVGQSAGAGTGLPQTLILHWDGNAWH